MCSKGRVRKAGAGTDHRTTHRCDDRYATVGRSFRRSLEEYSSFRTGCVERRRRHRARLGGRRDPPIFHRPTMISTAYDLYLRALRLDSSNDENATFNALGLLDQAIALDRHYGPALSLAAIVTSCSPVAAAARKAGDRPPQPVSILLGGPSSVETTRMSSHPLPCARAFRRGHRCRLGFVDLVTRLNPSCARGWISSGALRALPGQPAGAIEHVERLLRLSPRDRLTDYLTGIGEALFFSRRFDEAAAKLLASLERAPARFPVTYRVLAACYAHMGKLDEAREIVERLPRHHALRGAERAHSTYRETGGPTSDAVSGLALWPALGTRSGNLIAQTAGRCRPLLMELSRPFRRGFGQVSAARRKPHNP